MASLTDTDRHHWDRICHMSSALESLEDVERKLTALSETSKQHWDRICQISSTIDTVRTQSEGQKPMWGFPAFCIGDHGV